jgi:hypothetical protein
MARGSARPKNLDRVDFVDRPKPKMEAHITLREKAAAASYLGCLYQCTRRDLYLRADRIPITRHAHEFEGKPISFLSAIYRAD